MFISWTGKSFMKYIKHDLYSRPWAILDKFMPFLFIIKVLMN